MDNPINITSASKPFNNKPKIETFFLNNEINSIIPHIIHNSERNIKIFAADSQMNKICFPFNQNAVACKTNM